MTVGDRVRDVARWIAQRSPRTILIAGWVIFVLGCYPGYMSVDSALQLYTVRSGDYTDYAPAMTALWGIIEYVAAGPFPMLALQSGLLLFGAYALLARVLAPRVAAVTAVAFVLFPPVFAPMAVIWPEPLLTGAVIAGTAALLHASPRWKVVGGVLWLVACSCHPAAVVALVPLALLAFPTGTWWRRAAFALALVVGVSIAARIADAVLVEHDTYRRQQQLEIMDIAGTLRRAKLKKPEVLEAAFAGLPIVVDPATFKERVTKGNDALDSWSFANGDNRIIDPVIDDAESEALSTDWRDTIGAHKGAYLRHRKTVARGLLATSGRWNPVFDSLGDFDLLAPLHHRATTSDWQDHMRVIVRGFAATPLFRPWIYFVLAIAAIVLARRKPLPRAFAISALAWELTMFVVAPGVDYRLSHWLVTATCLAVAMLAVARKASWRASDA